MTDDKANLMGILGLLLEEPPRAHRRAGTNACRYCGHASINSHSSDCTWNKVRYYYRELRKRIKSPAPVMD